MLRRGKAGIVNGKRDSFERDCSSSDEYESPSNGDSSDAESSDGPFDSDNDSQRSFLEETLYQQARSVVRRRTVSPLDSSEKHTSDDRTPRPDSLPAAQRGKQGREQYESFVQECFYFYRDACPMLCNRRTNSILLLCFSLWFAAQLKDAWMHPYGDPMNAVRKHSAEVRNRLRNRDVGPAGSREQGTLGSNKKEPRSFWGDAAEQLERLIPNSRPQTWKSNKDESLPKECQPTEWQTLSFPNCHEIHELDLREALGLRRHGITTESSTTETFGYVGAGLWRNVWKVRGRGNTTLVIKMMKGEHDVDHRNMERHRRDAISMERLTSSPNIVSIYGHCGNTVLTEHLPRGLDTLIYHDGDKKQSDTVATRQTPLGRLRLALHVARGVAAIHDLPGGPIIHADIQAKQFLVDSKGVVKLNDFNRCRFMANNTRTGAPCPVTIPSAPGGSRSPEEYRFDKVTEKLDIFSTAHVLYGILTGEQPWDDLWGSQVKKMVKVGKKPPIVNKEYLKLGTSDAALANLIDLAYELDPQDRPSASKLVAELELLIATEEAKQDGNHAANL